MKLPLVALIVVIACILTGCISTHSYVDPAYKKAKAGDIIPSTPPEKAMVYVEFQRNGEAMPAVTPKVKEQIVKALTRTKVFEPVETDAADRYRLSFVMNNSGDVGDAAKKGMKTGFTFGAMGSTVTDHYTFSGKCISPEGKEFSSPKYEHALHSTIGRTKSPEGLSPTTPEKGVNEIIDDFVLNFLKDYQASELNAAAGTK